MQIPNYGCHQKDQREKLSKSKWTFLLCAVVMVTPGYYDYHCKDIWTITHQTTLNHSDSSQPLKYEESNSVEFPVKITWTGSERRLFKVMLALPFKNHLCAKKRLVNPVCGTEADEHFFFNPFSPLLNQWPVFSGRITALANFPSGSP